jgi:hypothetical protein
LNIRRLSKASVSLCGVRSSAKRRRSQYAGFEQDRRSQRLAVVGACRPPCGRFPDWSRRNGRPRATAAVSPSQIDPSPFSVPVKNGDEYGLRFCLYSDCLDRNASLPEALLIRILTLGKQPIAPLGAESRSIVGDSLDAAFAPIPAVRGIERVRPKEPFSGRTRG